MADDDSFDCFLSHNSLDKEAVKDLGALLNARNIHVWIDTYDLSLGTRWQDGLEQGLRACRSVAVLIGPHGAGPWQRDETQAALSLAVDKQYPVFAVLLPGALDSQIPLFLRNRTWMDLRKGLNDRAGIDRLAAEITSTRPERNASGIPPGQAPGLQRSPSPGTLAAGPPTIILCLDCTGDRLSVRTLESPVMPPHTTPLRDLSPGRVVQDLALLTRALFESAFQMKDCYAAAGGSSTDDPTRHPLRLQLLCTDPTIADLPWHCLTHEGRRLGEAGWIIEVIDQPAGIALVIDLDNPLVIAPADPRLADAIGARSHATEVCALIRRLLADRRPEVRWVSNRRELDLELDLEHEPDFIYCFAQVDRSGMLALGKHGGQPDDYGLAALADRLAGFAHKPLLWLHLIEDREAPLERSLLWRLRRAVRLLLVQTASQSNLERSLEHTRVWMSAMADGKEEPAAVLSRLGDAQGVRLWFGASGVRLGKPRDPGAALMDHIRAALIRVLLGRQDEKLRLYYALKRASGGTLLLYGVCGDEQSCVQDLPGQTRQFIADLDRGFRIETRPLPYTLRASRTLFDDLTRQFKQDLNVTPRNPPKEALKELPLLKPESDETLVIALSWLLDVAQDCTPGELGDWLATWRRAVCEVLNRDEIPADYRVLVGACIQWPTDWPARHGSDADTLQQAIDQALRPRDHAPAHVRPIAMERSLALVKRREILEFYQDADPALKAALGTRQLPVETLADYLLARAGGRFQETVNLIYSECKEHYAGFNAFIEDQDP